MEKGIFITDRESRTENKSSFWDSSYKNNYGLTLEPGPGILTLKKEFRTRNREIVRAVVRSTALGVYVMYLNGAEIGNDELKPGWTDYHSRVFENEYDVTELVRENNLFVAEVSGGWWSGRISFGVYGYKPCAFCGEIEIVYSDGTKEIVATDGTWDSTVCGPVLTAEIWEGEYFDARIPHASVTPEAHEWRKAIPFTDYSCRITPMIGQPVGVTGELEPVSSTVHSGVRDNGTTFGEIIVSRRKFGGECQTENLSRSEAVIFDFGQNMVGRPEITVISEPGTRIELFFAEMLNDSGDRSRGNDGPGGSMYIENYRTALSRNVFVTSGGLEKFEVRHTFHGFRYAEIRCDKDIRIISVRGKVIGSLLGESGTFSCDHPEVNALYSNIVWGMKGNYLSIPTDCPQRDERLGWTGDTQIFCRTGSYLCDNRDFMRKWLGDLRDSQEGFDGAYGDVAPRVLLGKEPNSAWGDAGIIVPYNIWLMYGDKTVISEHFESMERYMKFLERYGTEGAATAYGDWLCYDVTDKRFVSVSYYAYDAKLMALYSRLLGMPEKETYYLGLFRKIREHWTERYVEGDRLSADTQTGYILALAFGLVEGELKNAFITRLAEKIKENDYTLSTGFLGTGMMGRTLSECGLHKYLYSLLLQTKDPSWLYSVRQGATTVWERWNSYTRERGFGNVEMNSFNHYSYGAIAEWFYSGICGITPAEETPGFAGFLLRPTPDERTASEIPEGQRRINSACATYRSASGVITSGWTRYGDNVTYRFTVPKDTRATVGLICPDGKMIFNGADIEADELCGFRREGERAVFELGYGNYTVTINDPVKA